MQRPKRVYTRAFERHETEHVGQGGIDRWLRCRRAACIRERRRRRGRGGGFDGGFDRRLAGSAGGCKNENGGAKLHVRLGRTKAPRCGPVNSPDTSRRNASVSRVSSGVRIASTNPRAPANLASS